MGRRTFGNPIPEVEILCCVAFNAMASKPAYTCRINTFKLPPFPVKGVPTGVCRKASRLYLQLIILYL